jgi:hypothetical protein
MLFVQLRIANIGSPQNITMPTYNEASMIVLIPKQASWKILRKVLETVLVWPFIL